jgi:hypothetical protein
VPQLLFRGLIVFFWGSHYSHRILSFPLMLRSVPKIAILTPKSVRWLSYNEQGEPAAIYRWTGWVWGITGWSSRLLENCPSFNMNLRNTPNLPWRIERLGGLGSTRISKLCPKISMDIRVLCEVSQREIKPWVSSFFEKKCLLITCELVVYWSLCQKMGANFGI